MKKLRFKSKIMQPFEEDLDMDLPSVSQIEYNDKTQPTKTNTELPKRLYFHWNRSNK
jgi:hypothetical protein